MEKLKRKFDLWFWFIVLLFPLIGFLFAYHGLGGEMTLLAYIDNEYAFAFVRNIIDDVWRAVFGAACPIGGFASYIVLVEIIHCFVYVLVFIPRMAQKFIDWGCNLWQKS